MLHANKSASLHLLTGTALSHGVAPGERLSSLETDIEERTPLQSAVIHLKNRHNLLIKTCNAAFILLASLLIGLSIAFLTRFILLWPGSELQHKFDEYHALFQVLGSNQTISDHLAVLTREPHVAGTPENFATAEYVLSTFQKYKLSAYYTDYNVLVSYPLDRKLSLTQPNGSVLNLSLKEEALAEDSYTQSKEVIPAFHAYAPSGNISADVVYVNYGREEDFKKLKELGVDVNGTIVIARYGKLYRGDIVDNAAKAGALAAILYSDPQDYAENGTHGYYPQSKWLPSSGIQRGTTFQGVGDPLTPGWPSTSYAERLDSTSSEAHLPKIPSLPISSSDARPILVALNGSIAPPEWHGGLDVPTYRVGRGAGRLHFSYTANLTRVPIRNVYAAIKGFEEPDRYVLLGNHRDAWTFGAVDPSSGTAALLELSHRLSKLVDHGWRPRRTILLCSWDAEEFGLVGSTEWVEQNLDLLSARAVAYINVDCAVAGLGFFAAATPQLDDLLQKITKKVQDPDSPHKTIYDSWLASGGGSFPLIGRFYDHSSDYTAFVQHVGVPAIDFYFGADYPVYHSLYDNYNWMKKFGDPCFQRHVAASTVWGLLALELADNLLLPFSYVTYSTELQAYVKTVEEQLLAAKAPHDVTVAPLNFALSKFQSAAVKISQEAEDLKHLVSNKRTINDQLLLAERAFLDVDGLRRKPWFKHLVYGPLRNHSGPLSFPGILDALADAVAPGSPQNWAVIQHEIWRVSRVIIRAALVLQGELN
ncbi:hypothetical protein O6H91_03G097800 [Diphasiastrum complanatum]|uniref:Uncharacterized protein n=1 Tax=Diphasiastrum complanatum TaxID=34168 RepID=A0ACC2E9D9_DIPCM|nr:hypothetical protein O6H91_03G097800 [Diphasiastrum complanatum]